MGYLLFFFFFLIVISSATACDQCIHQSKVSHYHYDVPNSNGHTCQYGSHWEFQISKGYFAVAAPSLYRHGAACGACYQVRCKNRTLCNNIGTKVVLTDLINDNTTDFMLSRKAFAAMASKGKTQQLLNNIIIDAEYMRIPCEYKNKNLVVEIVEWSHKPKVLAIKFLYQGGKTDILAVNITQGGVHFPKWRAMIRNYGAIWYIPDVPKGALKLRIMVNSGYTKKWISTNYVIPADWTNGKIYDTRIQIKDIMKEVCPIYGCTHKPWK